MKGRVTRGKKSRVLAVILTIAGGGQILLSFLLCNEGRSAPFRQMGWGVLDVPGTGYSNDTSVIMVSPAVAIRLVQSADKGG